MTSASGSATATAAHTAIIVALPREAAALTQDWHTDRQHHGRGIYVWSHATTLVVAAGMGQARATLAVEFALSAGPVSQLISAGLAGACDPQLAAGSVVEATDVIDVRTGERYRTGAQDVSRVVLATGSSVAGVREKARLFATYGAIAVDMEAATVARLATAHSIPFRAIKAVSDDFATELEGMDRFATHHGHFHTRRFALHTAVRPHTWARTVRLGRHSAQALRALNSALQLALSEPRPLA